MNDYMRMAGGGYAGLEAAIEKLHHDLPGWWWSLGNCHVSADATIGPDRTGPCAHLLRFREFDEGIDGTLLHPATCTEALLNAIELAKQAKARAEAVTLPTTDFEGDSITKPTYAELLATLERLAETAKKFIPSVGFSPDRQQNLDENALLDAFTRIYRAKHSTPTTD